MTRPPRGVYNAPRMNTQEDPGAGRWERLVRFLQTDVWDLEPEHLSRVRAVALYYLRMLLLIVRGFYKDELPLRASALTYQTVFSIVPGLAVVFALLKAFALEPLEAHLRDFLSGTLYVGTDNSQVTQYIDSAMSNVHAGAIGVAGMLIVVVTLILLLSNIEQAFNMIWGVKKERSWFRRITIYWTGLSLGPVLLTGSLALTTWLQWQVNQRLDTSLPWIAPFLGRFLPYLFSWIAFIGLYYFMPNTNVNWRSAVVAGFVCGTVWEFSKRAYVFYNAYAVANLKIYGTLSVIPILLIWLYVSWIIVLLGAELAFAHQNAKTYRREFGALAVSQAVRERLAVALMLAIGRRFVRNEPPASTTELSKTINVPLRLVHDLLYELASERFVIEVSAERDHYVPGRDLARITVEEVIRCTRTFSEASPHIGDDGHGEVVAPLLAEAEAARGRVLSKVTIQELAAGTPHAL
ncbi:MAG: YihY family inner membrane protein [Planctomycetes bacterium]|nr:YihY family inner membrane protein [Planctomycetota bacterium]